MLIQHISWAARLAGVIVGLVAGAAPAQEWTPFAPPSPSDSGHNFLYGVSALRQDRAWAVGLSTVQTFSDYDTYSLAVHWDGRAWTQAPTPSPGVDGWGTDCALYDVEAISPDDVWGAGYKTMEHPDDGFVGTQLFVVHWDGSSWTEVEAPITPMGGTGAYVRDIFALAPDDIWFVGLFNFVNAGGPTGLAMHWDGSGFTLHKTPNMTQDPEKNLGISRDAQGNLWIAGMVGRGGWGSIPYVFRGEGDDWELVGTWSQYEYSDLQTIAAFSDDDVWIGMSKIVDYHFVGYVWMHWDGSGWTEFPVPDHDHEPHLAAFGPDDIYSGGESSLFHYDGSAWTFVDRFDGFSSPSINRINVALDGSVFGAGRYFPDMSVDGKTLAARFVPGPSCPADFNGDGAVNTLDVLAFLNAWSVQDPRADFNGDGAVNTLDVLAYLNAWNVGC